MKGQNMAAAANRKNPHGNEPSVVSPKNPIGLKGIEFVEFTSHEPEKLHQLFTGFGFSRLMRHQTAAVDYYRQNDIHFLLSTETGGFSEAFRNAHGASICAMGFRVEDAAFAFEEAVRRGAKPYQGSAEFDLPAVYGIGDSLIYFVDHDPYQAEFKPLDKPDVIPDKGFLYVDHLTNNVYKGTKETWADFYKNIFGFVEIRYFDIKGEKTGLTSFALKSPCQTFSIPINEGNEDKSQIEEYLRDYHGPGIQHLAFATADLLGSLDKLSGSGIETLDITPDYYETVFDRVPNVTEDRARIRNHQVLVDGDEEGYLLQIFTKNLVGPIFIEMIQRKNHHSFGEGNFGALFKSIERDQARRGVL